jgi:methanogenic corrinoid protein MtbC1
MEGYNIRTVAQLTGLSAHVIRAWERRYGAVKPARTDGNQRTYSEGDVGRLRLLARAVEGGHAIGRVAALPDARLEQLVSAGSEPAHTGREVNEFVKEALDAVWRLNPIELEEVMRRAAEALGHTAAIENVIVPLMDAIGRAWHQGKMRIMHEHMASAVLRSFLGAVLRAYETADSSPSVVVATPSGQAHELGALACAVTAASVGLQVTYLGADVPADEIIAAAGHTESRAVILSVVFPRNMARAREECLRTQKGLPQGVRLILGGASASALGTENVVRTMEDLKEELVGLRESSGPRSKRNAPSEHRSLRR